MLQVLCEIILSILCVYGGYRLLHDLVNLLERMSGRRQARRKDQNSKADERSAPPAAPDGKENPAKGGEDAENHRNQ